MRINLLPKQSQRMAAGFTLVEMLVAAALFSLVMISAVNLFIIFLRRPLQQIDEYHVYEEVNYALNELTAHARESYIDYATYVTVTNPATDLYMVEADGVQFHAYLSAGQLWVDTTNGSTTTTTPLTSSSTADVYIDSFTVYLYPSLDPFDVTTGENSQPAVVISIVGHSVTNTTVTFASQTLISTRVYER